jgi:hypothetical protein
MGAYDTMRFPTSAIPDEALEWASLTGVESLHGRAGTHTAHAPGPQTRPDSDCQLTQTASGTVNSVTSVIIGYQT